MKVAFLILHYNEIELTKKAVKSILAMNDDENSSREIVIVDNCSPNLTGEEMVNYYLGENEYKPEQEVYTGNAKSDKGNDVGLHFILNKENGGFSKGNNIGYSYIRNRLNADFVVALNNDITFPQKDFVTILIGIYNDEKSKFYLAGPDVYTPHIRSHISPLFDRPRGLKETEEKLRSIDETIEGFENRTSFGQYFRYIQDKYQQSILLKIYNKIRRNEYSGASPFDKPAYNCILNGACIIVDRRYLDKYDVLFDEKTFMYAEEDFITRRLSQNNEMIRYCPELVAYHVGQGTSGFTKMNYKQYCKKNADSARKIKEAFEIYRNSL